MVYSVHDVDLFSVLKSSRDLRDQVHIKFLFPSIVLAGQVAW